MDTEIPYNVHLLIKFMDTEIPYNVHLFIKFMDTEIPYNVHLLIKFMDTEIPYNEHLLITQNVHVWLSRCKKSIQKSTQRIFTISQYCFVETKIALKIHT